MNLSADFRGQTWCLDWPASLPNSEPLAERARRLLKAGGPLPACRHVLSHGQQPIMYGWAPWAQVCVACPAEGLRCVPCHNSHVEDGKPPHTWTAEHACDECGAVGEVIAPFSILLNATPPHWLRVRGLDGRKRVVSAPVQVRGLGFCLDCKTKVPR
jgi:hypothetical protein